MTGAVTLRQVEGLPDLRPELAVDGVTVPADLAEAVWQRIEGHIAWRFIARDVVWTVEGVGRWRPPLHPAQITVIEEWTGGAWQAALADPCPLGGLAFPRPGPWRVSAVVGENEVPPAAVRVAAALLAGYLKERDELAGMRAATRIESAEGFGGDDGPTDRIEVERPATWAARALQYSGAADNLRFYRRCP